MHLHRRSLLLIERCRGTRADARSGGFRCCSAHVEVSLECLFRKKERNESDGD